MAEPESRKVALHMTVENKWRELDRKLVAILRGIDPGDVSEVVTQLLETGFRAIEIPLNSPDPFRSIESAVKAAEKHSPRACLIGAGTVLSVDDVKAVRSSGGNLIVSPNTNEAVIEATIENTMVSLPGVFTATEAHMALAKGASGLKFFPASILGPKGIAAIKVILPADAGICAVGGIEPSDFPAYFASGVNGFGLGSCLYAPGKPLGDIIECARSAITVYDQHSR